MPSRFSTLDYHSEVQPFVSPTGRVVLSRLDAGRSRIGGGAPSLKIVLDGEALYNVDGRSVRVGRGQFLYLEAGESMLTHRTKLVGICVNLPLLANKPEPLPNGSGQGDDPVFGRALVLSTHGHTLGRLLEQTSERIVREPDKGPELAESLIRQANLAIHGALGDSRQAMAGLKVVKASTRRALFERLEHARGYLHEHEHRAVALGELANVAGLSQFHLARFFKLAFGSAPIAYHRMLRLKRAGALLVTGRRSLLEVAELTGYSDEVALSHAFRRHYGASPQFWANSRRN